MSTFTYEDSDGKEFTAKDTAENRVAVQNQGYTIQNGVGKTIAEIARGADEVMGDHALSKYNPAALAPRAVAKAIAGLGDARTNEEIKADKLIYEDSDGKQYTATNSPDNIKTLTDQGYKVHDLTTEGARGMASAFGEQSQNQYLFGIPHMLDNPEEKKRHEDLANENPVSNIAGGVAGTVASLLTPGLNMAKGASLAERGAVAGLGKLGIEGTGLAGKAAIAIGGEAARGAVYAAPHALAEAIIDQDPVKAGKEVLLGLGIGGLFGVGRLGVSQAVEKIAPKLTQEALDSKASEMLAEQSGIKTAAQKSKLESIGRTGEDVVDEFGNKLNKEGIDRVVQLLEEAGVYKGSPRQIAENILKVTDESGPGVGKVISALDKGLEKTAELPKPEGVSVFGFDYRKLASDISTLSHGMVGPMLAGERKAVEEAANQVLAVGDKFGTKEGDLSFEQAQKLKKIMQGETNYRTDRSDGLNDLHKTIASMTRQEMENAADRVTTATGDANLVKEWGTYKDIWAASKVLNKAAEKTLAAKDNAFKWLPDIGLHAIGSAAIGNMVHGGPGGLVGGLAVNYLKKLASTYFNQYGRTQAALALKKVANSPDFASYLVLASSAATKAKVSEIAGAIENMAVRGAVPAITHDPVKKILGEDANGLSKEQQYNKISQAIIDSHSNPQGMQAHLNELIAPISELHPAVGDAMMEDSLKKMEYLYSILPKNPNAAPKPFARDEKWKPTPVQMKDFNKQLAVANDPFHVIEELKAGTLTSKQVATLAYLNPEVLQMMRDEITKMAYSGKAVDLSYQQKLQVSLLMGESMVKTLDYIQPAQAVYGVNFQGTPGPSEGSGKKSPKINNDKFPLAQGTPAQRISR